MSVGSGTLSAFPLSVDLDAAHPLATEPGELLAGAMGTIFTLFAARTLASAGTHPREFVATVTLTASDGDGGDDDLALSAITCRLLARVPQIDEQRLEEVANVAMSECIDALRLRGEELAVTVEAVLEGP
jgi:organic hydroperoxide reductase OsmC/OhrA